MVFLTLFCLVSGVLRCAVGSGKPCCNLDGCNGGVCEREHLIFALSEESTPVLQPAMSFSLVLLLDAVLSKGIRGLNFVVYVLGVSRSPTKNLSQGLTDREFSL